MKNQNIDSLLLVAGASFSEDQHHKTKMPLPAGVPFEVVEIWYNDLYTPYTILPTREDSVKNYAIRVAGLYFLLGDENNDSLHICDSEDFVEPVDKA